LGDRKGDGKSVHRNRDDFFFWILRNGSIGKNAGRDREMEEGTSLPYQKPYKTYMSIRPQTENLLLPNTSHLFMGDEGMKALNQYRIREIPLEPTIDLVKPGESMRFTFGDMDQARQFVDLIEYFQDREEEFAERADNALKEMESNNEANNEFLGSILEMVEKIYYDDLDIDWILKRGTDIKELVGELNDNIEILKGKLEVWVDEN